jgi:hypothetical protein
MDITERLESFSSELINSKLEELATCNNLDKRMSICDEIIDELQVYVEEDDDEYDELVDQIKDLAI